MSTATPYFVGSAVMFVIGVVGLLAGNAQGNNTTNFGVQRQTEEKATPSASALTPMDELKQLKELLDLGAITQEEFEQKKKSLLEKM